MLQFFSGNIGFHHVHHLSARIPSYNLQRAHDENPVFHDVPTLSFTDGLRALRFKLYDQGRGRMVSFAQARASSRGKLEALTKPWSSHALVTAQHTSPGERVAAPGKGR